MGVGWMEERGGREDQGLLTTTLPQQKRKLPGSTCRNAAVRVDKTLGIIGNVEEYQECRAVTWSEIL